MKELKTKGGFLTEAGRRAVKQDYKAGLKNREIQDKYDLSSATVWKNTKHLSYKKRKNEPVVAPKQMPVEPETQKTKKFGKILTLDRMDIFRRLGQGQDVYTIARETGNKLNSIRYFADMYHQGELARKKTPTEGKPFAFDPHWVLWLMVVLGLAIDLFVLVKYLGY